MNAIDGLMLEEFELWILKKYGMPFLCRDDSPKLWGGDDSKHKDNPYSHPFTAGAWEAWKHRSLDK